MPLSPDLVAILACPESKQPLLYHPAGGGEGDREFLFCPVSRLVYPVVDDVAVMLVEEAERLEPDAAAALAERLATAEPG